MARPTFRAAYAKHVLHEQVLSTYNRVYNRNDNTLPQPDQNFLGDKTVTPDYNQAICIVGAGAAGLSAAVMLHFIGFTNITVLEASSRIGGRAYTHHFKAGAACSHNYYDVGAMRIPLIDTQLSTQNMIKWLNENGEKVPTADYTYSAGMEPTWYGSPTDDNTFDDYMTVLLKKNNFPMPLPPMPPPPMTGGPSSDIATTSSMNAPSFDEAFLEFMKGTKQPDKYSTRAWLMLAPQPDGPRWTYSRTEAAETSDTSTGLFDQAFMETICDWYDFNAAKLTKASWKRIEGGMSVLTDALYNYATKNGINVIRQCPVTAMKDEGGKISVTYAGSPHPAPQTKYAAVFSTTTFGCLQRMDLLDLKLSSDNLCGIRALSYDRATKVAIKFKTAWWRDLIPNGGVLSTDLSISKVVYPSWDDGPTSAYTIIVSYSWAQDATRMAALMHANDQESTNPTDPIVQLCLRDLVTLWSKTNHHQTVEKLQHLYIAHHVFSWSHDPYTAGAYALFGPGQFQYLYPQFTKPLCGDKLSICGEAVSAHHAWISGAFDSSYNAIYAWCQAHCYRDTAKKLKKSPFGGGENENTAELDENVLNWHLGLAKKEQEYKMKNIVTQA